MFSFNPQLVINFFNRYQPTKTDSAVFNALQTSECKLNPEKYPNIYKWFHTISLYKEEERNK